MGVNNLPKVVMQHPPEQDLNPRPIDRKSNTVPVALPRHKHRLYTQYGLPISMLAIGMGILPIPVLQYGHPSPNSNINTNLHSANLNQHVQYRSHRRRRSP